MLSTLFSSAKKTPAPGSLVPCLRDATHKSKRHYLTALYPGDQLHTTHKLLGYGRGAVLPVYGFAAEYDTDGQLTALRAYVRPLSTQQVGVVPYENREFARRPAPHQREQWFGFRLLYVREIDLLDHADCLRLARLEQRLSELLHLPATTEAATPTRQAA